MRRYRSHTGQPAPDYDAALQHFQTVHRRDSLPPAVVEFRNWLHKARVRDRRMLAVHGRTNGLLHHIRVTQNWLLAGDTEWRTSEERGRSSIDVGQQVDAELESLHTGTALTPHRYTQWLIAYLYERRWLPCAFQVPIWSADGSVRTQADMIVYDGRRFVLIELKTGYDNDYDTPMRERTPLDYFEQTRRTMCHLQLGWMYFELDRAAHPWPLDAYVLRVSSKHGVRRPEPLQLAVQEYYREQYTDLAHLSVLVIELTDTESESSTGASDSEEDEASAKRRRCLEE